MKYLHIIRTAVALSAVALYSGCGGNSGGLLGEAGTNTLKASQGCIDCHSYTESPVVAGAKIADQWKRSTHNTALTGRTYGAGCIDCHEPDAGHPNNCGKCHGGAPGTFTVTGTDLVKNPDASGKCYKCHSLSVLSPGHYDNNTSLGSNRASFVSKQYKYNCRACHDPHDSTSGRQVTFDWHSSGHGRTDPYQAVGGNGVAWMHYDFKDFNYTAASAGGGDRRACIRCHTTTGYQDYVTGKKPALPTTTWATPGDKTKQLLACDACHTSYDFKKSVRKLGAFTAPYGVTKPDLTAVLPPSDGLYNISYPDAGQSNICIRCHAGRENGGSIEATTATPVKSGRYKSAITEMTAVTAGVNFGSFNSHYLAAALNFYGKAGFHFYSSMYKYDTGYNTGSNFGTWNHGKLGMIDPATGKNFVASQVAAGTPGVNTDSGSNGPCIACHRGNQGGTHNANSHRGKPQLTAKSVAPAGGCYGCHGAGTANPEKMADLIEEEKAIFDIGMEFFEWNLRNHYLVKDPTTGNKIASRQLWYAMEFYPYFYTSPTADVPPAYVAANYFKGPLWTMGTGDVTTAKMFLGAAYNFNMLMREKGAHVHNRTYTKRLIYDSIQYLQYGIVTSSDATKKVSFTDWSSANRNLSSRINYVPYPGPTRYYGANAVRKWLVNGSGYRK